MATVMVPEARELDADGWRRAEAIVEDALAARPPGVRRQLALFVRVAHWLPVLRWGRPLTRLSPDRRLRYLRWLARAPVLAIRRGAWGVRTLAFMAYYGQEEVRTEIGYRAHPRGWRERRARPDGGDRTPPHGEGAVPSSGPQGGDDDAEARGGSEGRPRA